MSNKLTGALGGVDNSASAGYLLDVEWKDDDPLFVFNGDNATKPQTPTIALTPIRASDEEDSVAPAFKPPVRKESHF